MELSSLELSSIVDKLNRELLPAEGPYYLSNMYSVFDEAFLFRFHHASLPKKQLIISPGKGLWITRYSIEETGSIGYVTSLRRQLERGRVTAVEQPHGERICLISFDTKSGERKLVCEFFREGNLAVVDQDFKILSCLRKLKVRHREISPGNTYSFPPTRGKSLLDLDRLSLDRLLESDLQASKWIGRTFSTSRKYTEEILSQAAVPPDAVGSSMNQEDLDRIFSAAEGLRRSILAHDSPVWILSDGSPRDVIPTRFRTLKSWTLVQSPSLMTAIDEVFTHELKHGTENREDDPLRQKIKVLEKSIERQHQSREDAIQIAATLRDLAQLIQGRSGSIEDILKDTKTKYSMSKAGDITIAVRGSEFETERGISPMKLASTLFNRAKENELKGKAILDARLRLQADLEKMRTDVSLSVQKRKTLVNRATPLWFERYRWFKTTDGLLSIGGRDAHSNSAIIRKHTKPGDVVFHAEIVGSPFFVLKGIGEVEQGNSFGEVAQAVFSFSRAWREGLAGDAYWVRPEQVKTQAPSGMYLSRGSFLIEGKKNFVKGLVPEIAIGTCRLDNNRLGLMGGPKEAVRKNSVVYLVLRSERSKSSDTAKKVKREILGLLDWNQELMDVYKSMSLDEYVRVLPAGGGRIVMKGAGEKREEKLS